MKKNAAIIGIGLLGSSLGMALRNKGYLRSEWTRRPAITRWALDHDAIDIGYDTLKLALVSGKQVRKTATASMPKRLMRDGRSGSGLAGA